MNKLFLSLFSILLLSLPIASEAMFRARMSTATRVVKEYSHRVMQVAQKPFLTRVQKSVEKKFPTPQFKSYAQPDFRTVILNTHQKLVNGLSNSQLDLWKNRSNVFSSVFGLGHTALVNYPIFLTLDPTQQLLKTLMISGQIAFCYFGAKKLLKESKEMARVHNELSLITTEQKQEFKLYEDVQ